MAMDASTYPVSSARQEPAGLHPVLIAASSDGAKARARVTAEAAGFRVAAVAVEEAVDRLDRQVAASALWIEIDRDCGPSLDLLLERVEFEASRNQLPAVICSPLALIDRVVGYVHQASVELLVDPSLADRAAALAIATNWTRVRTESRSFDVSKDTSAARLRQLSDEVSRIAATLARLSTGPGPNPVEKPEPAAGDAPPVSLETVRQVIRARRLRARYFDEELFADPAWDMLLDLLQAEIAQHRVPVSSLCIAAAVPATTALRWIKTMTDAGLFRRRADPHDGRRVFVELAPKASDAMHRFFGEVGKAIIV
jgi:DNA-binding MarR family transcriptional regulator